jgi:hypothetical protein
MEQTNQADQIVQTNPGKGGSKKVMYVIIAIVVIIIVWYFLRGSFGMIGGVNGVNIGQNLDGSATYSNAGGTVTVGGNALPANWPSDVPTYANATIQYAGSSNPQTGEKGSAVVFMTSDSAQKVVDFYKQALASKGWVVEQAATIGASTVLAANKDTRTVGVYIADAGSGKVSVTVSIAIPGSQ